MAFVPSTNTSAHVRSGVMNFVLSDNPSTHVCTCVVIFVLSASGASVWAFGLNSGRVSLVTLVGTGMALSFYCGVDLVMSGRAECDNTSQRLGKGGRVIRSITVSGSSRSHTRNRADLISASSIDRGCNSPLSNRLEMMSVSFLGLNHG